MVSLYTFYTFFYFLYTFVCRKIAHVANVALLYRNRRLIIIIVSCILKRYLATLKAVSFLSSSVGIFLWNSLKGHSTNMTNSPELR